MTYIQDTRAWVADNRRQIHAVLQARLIGKLAHDLSNTRRHPIHVLKERLLARIARFFSKQGSFFSYRRQMRLARSVNRRHPDRAQIDAGLLSAIGSGSMCPSASEYTQWITEEEANQILPPPAQESVAHRSPVLTLIVEICAHNDLADVMASFTSLQQQSFSEWNVVFVHKHALETPLADALLQLAQRDTRVTLCDISTDEPVFLGSHVAVISSGDVLAAFTCSCFANHILTSAPPVLIYGDDDALDAANQRTSPRFKSRWNRDLLYATNYIGSFAALQRDVFERLYATTPDILFGLTHNALLAATADLNESAIVHIPRVLRHVPSARAGDMPTSISDVEAFLQQHETPKITLVEGRQPETYQAVWPIPDSPPKVCLVVPTRDQKALTETAVTSILEYTAYDAFEIVIVDNGSIEPEMLTWLDSIASQEPKVRVLSYPHPFNYSAINNFAVAQTDATIIGLLNNDVEVIHSGWMHEMVGHAVRPDIGCVGAKLHFADSTIQHAGVALGIGPVAGHIFAKASAFAPGYLNYLQVTRNSTAVTGACLFLRRDLYEHVGGLNAENLAVTCNDVDLCLKTHKAGYRTLWTPHAVLLHHESASRGQDISPEKKMRLEQEQAYMIKTWSLNCHQDPYLNANLFNWL